MWNRAEVIDEKDLIFKIKDYYYHWLNSFEIGKQNFEIFVRTKRKAPDAIKAILLFPDSEFVIYNAEIDESFFVKNSHFLRERIICSDIYNDIVKLTYLIMTYFFYFSEFD